MRLKGFFQLLCQFAVLVTLTACNHSVSAAKSNCSDSTQQFWQKFRAAVEKNDTNAIAGMTNFPFVVIRSITDESDKVNLERAEFIKELPRFLSLEAGVSQVPTSMQATIIKTVTLQSKQCAKSSQQFNVGSWFFHLKNDGWRFTRVYTEEN